MIKITYISKDGHKFEYKSEKKKKEDVILDGYNRIKELNYDRFGYILKDVEEKN